MCVSVSVSLSLSLSLSLSVSVSVRACVCGGRGGAALSYDYIKSPPECWSSLSGLNPKSETFPNPKSPDPKS